MQVQKLLTRLIPVKIGIYIHTPKYYHAQGLKPYESVSGVIAFQPFQRSSYL